MEFKEVFVKRGGSVEEVKKQLIQIFDEYARPGIKKEYAYFIDKGILHSISMKFEDIISPDGYEVWKFYIDEDTWITVYQKFSLGGGYGRVHMVCTDMPYCSLRNVAFGVGNIPQRTTQALYIISEE